MRRSILLAAMLASTLAAPALAQSTDDLVVFRRQIARANMGTPSTPTPTPTATARYGWVTGEYSMTETCSASATPTRQVSCNLVDAPHTQVDASLCDPATRPSSTGAAVEIYTGCTATRSSTSPSVCTSLYDDRIPTRRAGEIRIGTVTRSTQNEVAQVARTMCEANVESRTGGGKFYCYMLPLQGSTTTSDVMIVKASTVLSASGNPWEVPYPKQARDYMVGDCVKR